MNEEEVINIFKRYSDEKTERSHLAHSWPGLRGMKFSNKDIDIK